MSSIYDVPFEILSIICVDVCVYQAFLELRHFAARLTPTLIKEFKQRFGYGLEYHDSNHFAWSINTAKGRVLHSDKNTVTLCTSRHPGNAVFEMWFSWGVMHRIGGPALRCRGIDAVPIHYSPPWVSDVHDLYSEGLPSDLPSWVSPGFDTYEAWYEDGKLHRDGGPAVTCELLGKVRKSWYCRGQLHNLAGPADIVQNKEGAIYRYYVHGVMINAAKKT